MSVVIPAFNEGRIVTDSLTSIVLHLESRNAAFEVLVVDDGSTDDTASRVEAYPSPHVRLLRQPQNRGKGAALRAGVLAASHDYVLLCDADLAAPIEEVERLFAASDGASVVLGSRYGEGADVERSLLRRFLSRSFNMFVHSAGLCRGIRDTQCGFKLLRLSEAQSLFRSLEIDGFSFDVELVELALHRGLEVVEVGVRWRDAGESSVRPVRDARRVFSDILAVRQRMRSRHAHAGRVTAAREP